MPAGSPSHPDRLAATMAHLAAARALRPGRDFEPPGAGAADCRIDVKLAEWRALRAAERSPAAREHLAACDAAEHPDLWAGTVRDGVARGFLVRLEEAAALAPPEPGAAPPTAPPDARVTVGKELRRRRDLLLASAGPRFRFARKTGLVFVDRGDAVHSANCFWFEARRDLGTLDGFVADPGERARLFSAQFLQPQQFVEHDAATELQLAGRLGRGPIGWRCRVTLRAERAAPDLGITIELHEIQPGWRLRCRWLGLPAAAIAHACTPVREIVANERGGFVADTLVRSCTTLLVDGAPVAVPDAAGRAPLVHQFRIGATAAAGTSAQA